MKRRFRLTRSADFERVRRSGKTYVHPFVVLIVLPAENSSMHVGIAAGRSLGGAVQRNRAKRRLRAVLHDLLPTLQPGYDIVLLARQSMARAKFPELQFAVQNLLKRAKLTREINESTE